MHRIDATAGVGDVEIWEIKNLHIMPHPMHIHGVQFQVLERFGGLPSTPVDNGWKDTILVWKEETVRLIMRIGPYKGTYLIHCHNLEHEDHGMMLNYEVTDIVTAVEEGRELPGRLDLR
jgi:FtsP/CotA-like multicopper oxidase with cupredoxin domain